MLHVNKLAIDVFRLDNEILDSYKAIGKRGTNHIP